jgi:hypothetical protein
LRLTARLFDRVTVDRHYSFVTRQISSIVVSPSSALRIPSWRIVIKPSCFA